MWLYSITDRVSYTLSVQSQSCDYTVLLTAYPTRCQCSLSHVTIQYYWPRILHAVSAVSVMWLYCITDRVSYTLVQSQSCDYTVLLTAYPIRCQCSLSHVTILYYWPRILYASAVSVMWLYTTPYPIRCQCSLSHVTILYNWPRILHAVSAVSVMWLYCITDRVSYAVSAVSVMWLYSITDRVSYVSAVSVMWLYSITDRVSYTLSVQSQSCAYTVLLTAYPTRCQCSLSHVTILHYWPRISYAVSAVSVMWLYSITVSYTVPYPIRCQCRLSHVTILYYWPRILHAVSAVSVMWLYCITDRVSYTLSVQSQSCDYTVLLTAYPTRCQCSLSHVTILYYWPRISYTLSVQSQSCDYTVLLTAYPTRCQCSLSHVTILYYWPRISYTLSVQSQSCDYTVLLTAYPTRCQCSLSHVTILYYWPRISYTLSVQSQSCDYTVLLTAYPTRCQCSLSHVTIQYYWPRILHVVSAVSVMWLYSITDRVSYTLSVQSQSCDYTVLLTAYPTRCQCSLSHVTILYYWPRILHAVSAVSVMWLYCITDRVSYTLSVQSQSCDYTVLLTAYPTRCQCSLQSCDYTVLTAYPDTCSLSHVTILLLTAYPTVSVMWLYCITDRVSYTLSVQSQSCDYTVLLTAYPTRCQCSLSHVTIQYYWPRILHVSLSHVTTILYNWPRILYYLHAVSAVSVHVTIQYNWPRILHAVSAVSVMWLYCITDRVSYTLSVQSQSCDYTVLLTAYPTRCQCSLSHVTILYNWPCILHAVSAVSVMWLYSITDRVSYTLSVQSQSCDYTVLLTAYPTRCQCSLSHVTIQYYWPRISYTLSVQSQSCDYTVLLTLYPIRCQCSLSHVTIQYYWPRIFYTLSVQSQSCDYTVLLTAYILHAVSAVSVMWLYCITDRLSYTLSVQSQSCDCTVLLTAYPTRCQCSLSHVTILYNWPLILHAVSAVSVMWLYCITDRLSHTLSVQSQSCDYTV